MGKRTDSAHVDRRTFLSGVAAGAAGAVTGVTSSSHAATTAPSKLAPPSAQQVAAARVPEALGPADTEPATGRPGSDFMLDVIRSLKLDYLAALPGSSFRGLHESVINYGGNRAPELLTCLHEEVSVAMAHGYAKVAGKPMGVMAHSTVGLQHALMAVYNAWCDRVPVVILGGNTLDAAIRRYAEWAHSMQDPGLMVRDCTKWDDQPWSLQHFAESMVRAYRIATTPPMGPVLITLDTELQEHVRDTSGLSIPRLSPLTPLQGDSAAVAQATKWLVAAENPLIVPDRAVRTAEGLALMVELAELLGAPVADRLGRLNFPTNHPLNLTDNAAPLIRQADVILGLEVMDFWGVVNQVRDLPVRSVRTTIKPDTKLISIGTGELLVGSNYQDFRRYAPVDLAIAGDVEATLPALLEAVRRALPSARRHRVTERAERHRSTHLAIRERVRQDAAVAWNARPMTTARMHLELKEQIGDADWALVSEPFFQSFWALRLWNFDKHYQYIGGPAGDGLGYGAPAAVGAALAHRDHGRLVINIQCDGDLLAVPGSLWTAAHHKIPLLTIMHNNRAYHQEVMHIQRMANRRERGIDRAHIGTVIDDPAVDFAELARSMGVWASGPITDPEDYAPALQQAIEVVKSGAPALIDVVSQPR